MKTVNSDALLRDEWNTFFARCEVKRPDPVNPAYQPSNSQTLTLHEHQVRAVLKAVNSNKAAGPDGMLQIVITYRSEVLKCPVPSQSNSEQKTNVPLEGQDSLSLAQQDRRSPTGGAGVLENVEDQMFRSVEGQAASDEEEEKWIGDQQTQMAEVKKLLARFPCCNSGCDDTMLKHLWSSFGNPSSCGHENSVVELIQQLSKLKDDFQMKRQEEKALETNMEEVIHKDSFGTKLANSPSVATKDPLLGEIHQNAEESELMKMEFQMLETERVRLSLVEEKLLDVLQLLQQLRDLNISKRTLGKILLNTLESCCDSQHGKPPIAEVLDALYHELLPANSPEASPLRKHQDISLCQALGYLLLSNNTYVVAAAVVFPISPCVKSFKMQNHGGFCHLCNDPMQEME
ncbi:EF-hand and coiled-coil domain-containing protein 1-like [Thamnophis elegans]|uniref:EF-hand and coiled-coil domain-containing protein 1-like n=1 Tax=Thamnophis elegans TaxID=35005 RepID=UPI001377D5A6|nr:EF-hand and coiled-coil domain-containing protein 1-like [Thamnophis elegans]